MSKLQVDDIVNKDDTGSVGFSRGAVVTGIVTATGGSFSGNVSVGGVLTYEDVTNIDSVGIITARSDVSIADKIIHTGDTNTAIRFPANDTFTIETAGSEALRITSDGKMGLGTNSPSDNGSDTMLAVKRNASGQSASIAIHAASNAASLIRFADGTSTAAERNAGSLRVDHGTGSMQFSLQDSEKMQIDSSGRLLVGLSSPMETFGSAALQVATSAGGTLVLGREDSSVSPNNGLGAIYFDTYAGGAWAESAVIAAEADTNQGTNDYPSRLVFKTTADGASSPTEQMRIDSSGRMLLGQTVGTGVIRSHFDGTGWGGGNGSNTVSGLSVPQFVFDGVNLDNSGTVNPVGFQIRGGGGGVPRGYALGVYGKYATSALSHLFFVRNTGVASYNSTNSVPGAGIFIGDSDAYGSPAGSSWWNYSAPAHFGIRDSKTSNYDGSAKVGQTIELGGTYGGGSYNNWGGTCSAVRIATNFGGGSSNGTNIGYYADISGSGSGNNWGLYIANGGAAKPGGGSFTATSDARVKNVFGNYERGLNELLQLNPVKFAYNGKAKTLADDQERIGLLAQDVQPIMPELVSSRIEKLNEDDEEDTDILMVDPSDLVFTLVNAIKELSAQNAALEKRLTDAGIA